MKRILTDEDMKKAWGRRFRETRKEKYSSQEAFAEAMQKEGHATTQTTVGRWENVGGSYGKEFPGFPSFPKMQTISKLLDVQIGYLIGETDAKTFDTEDVMEYFGMSEKAVDSLRSLAWRKGANYGEFDEKYGIKSTSVADTLEKILTSKGFVRYVLHLNELDCMIDSFEEENSAEQREASAELQEKLHCTKFKMTPESDPDRFDDGGHLVDEDGRRMYDPNDPEKLAAKVFQIRDRTRISKCLLIDDQLAMMRELWPQVLGYDDGIADLGDAIVRVDETGCSFSSKAE